MIFQIYVAEEIRSIYNDESEYKSQCESAKFRSAEVIFTHDPGVQSISGEAILTNNA